LISRRGAITRNTNTVGGMCVWGEGFHTHRHTRTHTHTHTHTQVGSITGNTNTVGGGAVWPKASLGDFAGLQKMISGEKVLCKYNRLTITKIIA
jgi:hypothetical protein